MRKASIIRRMRRRGGGGSQAGTGGQLSLSLADVALSSTGLTSIIAELNASLGAATLSSSNAVSGSDVLLWEDSSEIFWEDGTTIDLEESSSYTHGADNIGSSGLTVPVLTWTTTSSDVRPLFDLENVVSPAVDDTFVLTINGVEYTVTLTVENLYNLSAAFNSLVPELDNGDYTVWVRWTRGANYVYSNTEEITINVAYSIPVFTVDPVIDYDGVTFSIVTEPEVTGRLTPTVSKNWQRDGVDISGETGATYNKASADEGTDVTLFYTATNASGSDTVSSNAFSIPTSKVYWASDKEQSGGFPGGSLSITNVDFGSYSGTRRALIHVLYFNGNNLSSLSVTGVGSASLVAQANNGSSYSSNLYAIDVADGGLKTVVINNGSNYSDLVLNVVTLDPALNSTPTDVVSPVWDAGGETSVTFMPGTTVPTNGAQIVFAFWTVNSDASYSNCTIENYSYYASGNEAYTHVLSSLDDVRITGTRAATWRGWHYIGLIFGP